MKPVDHRTDRHGQAGRAGGAEGGAEPPDFDRIFARYCQLSGEPWTDALEAELTWRRIVARFEFWRDDPPLAIMLQYLAAFVGWKPPEHRATGTDAMDAFKAMFPSGKI
jgi:hypothetical protein